LIRKLGCIYPLSSLLLFILSGILIAPVKIKKHGKIKIFGIDIFKGKRRRLLKKSFSFSLS